MSRKVKVGIIGAGTIGSVHAKAYAELPDAEVIGLCDILPDKLAEKAKLHNIPRTYATHQELLADPEIEAVSVCVPNYVHAPIAIDALRAGKHVMLEKPMSINAKCAQEVVDVRNETGKVLQMGMVRRQYAESEIIKKAIMDGRLGDIYQINISMIRRRGIPGLGGWFTTKEMAGGGALIDCAVHFLDLAMWCTELWQPTRVSARTYAKFGSPMKDYHYVSMWAGPPKYDGTFNVDDYSTGIVRFGDKTTMSFEIAWAANADERAYVEFLGTKGGIKIGGDKLILKTEMDNMIVDVQPMFNAEGNSFAKELGKFLAAVKGEGQVPATGEQGVILMKLLDAIYKSSDLNEEVEI